MRWLVLGVLVACGDKPAPVRPAPVAPTIAPASPGIELPEVALVGYAAADDAVAKIAVSPTAFTIAGAQVLALKDGALADGDAAKLEAAIGADTATGVPGVTLAFDRRVPIATLVETVRILHARGASQFRLLARAGAGQVAVTFGRATPAPTKEALAKLRPAAGIDRVREALDRDFIPQLAKCHDPKRGASGRLRLQMVIGANGKASNLVLRGADPLHACIRERIATWRFDPAPSRDLGMAIELPAVGFHTEKVNGKQVMVIDTVIVIESPSLVGLTITDAHLVLTIAKASGEQPPPIAIPRRAPTAFGDLTSRLVELVKRRSIHGRYDIDHELSIAVADPRAHVQLLAEVMGVVRVSPDGFPLFPELRLVVN